MLYETDLNHEINIKDESLDIDEPTDDEVKDDNNQIDVKLEETEPQEYNESQNNPDIKNEYLEDLQNVTINLINPHDDTDLIESEDPLNINHQQKSKLKQLHKKIKCEFCGKSFSDTCY